MPIGRTELSALRNLISEADLILETTPPLPQNRTGAARENFKAALALLFPQECRRRDCVSLS